jgi:hypothetical protein
MLELHVDSIKERRLLLRPDTSVLYKRHRHCHRVVTSQDTHMEPIRNGRLSYGTHTERTALIRSHTNRTDPDRTHMIRTCQRLSGAISAHRPFRLHSTGLDQTTAPWTTKDETVLTMGNTILD